MPQSAAAPLVQLISAELALLREFVTLLGDEQGALVRGELDRLIPLAEEKSRLAASLAQAAEGRNAALATLGLAKDRPGVETWLAVHPELQQTAQDWQILLDLAAAARDQNELNGKLIHSRLQQNQRALAALSAATHQTMLYGPDGQVHSSSGGRTFGKF